MVQWKKINNLILYLKLICQSLGIVTFGFWVTVHMTWTGDVKFSVAVIMSDISIPAFMKDFVKLSRTSTKDLK